MERFDFKGRRQGGAALRCNRALRPHPKLLEPTKSLRFPYEDSLEMAEKCLLGSSSIKLLKERALPRVGWAVGQFACCRVGSGLVMERIRSGTCRMKDSEGRRVGSGCIAARRVVLRAFPLPCRRLLHKSPFLSCCHCEPSKGRLHFPVIPSTPFSAVLHISYRVRASEKMSADGLRSLEVRTSGAM